jgi:CheY-like chemotaxis protein
VGPLSGTAVLIADDDADNIELLAFVIEQAGGTTRSARNGNEALAVLAGWTPDLLLLDISMPTMDGYELLRAIRTNERLRDTPAVAVTAHAFAADIKRCTEAGFVEHVSKPFDVPVLLALIESLASAKPASASRPVTPASGTPVQGSAVQPASRRR